MRTIHNSFASGWTNTVELEISNQLVQRYKKVVLVYYCIMNYSNQVSFLELTKWFTRQTKWFTRQTKWCPPLHNGLGRTLVLKLI